MPRVSPYQSNFNAGEVSPLLDGRVDADKYKQAVALCQNMIPTIQGPLTRRGGTKFVTTVKTSANKTRLIPFEFSVTQSYMLEFGDKYIRFFTQGAAVVDGSGNAIEVASPYSVTDVPGIDFAQSNDTLFLVHPSYPPKQLQRFSNTSWLLSDLALIDGPYLDTNITNANVTITDTNPTVGAGVAVTGVVGSNTYAFGGGYFGYAVFSGTTSSFVPSQYVYVNAGSYVGYYYIGILSGSTFSLSTTADGLNIVQYNGNATGGVNAVVYTTTTVTAGNSTVSSCSADANGYVKILFTAAHAFRDGDLVYFGASVAAYSTQSYYVKVVDSTHITLQGLTFTISSGGIVYYSIFALTDIGRMFQASYSGGPVWGLINGWQSPGIVTIKRTFPQPPALPVPITTYTATWRMGLYGQVNGYPATAVIHQDRFCLGGCPGAPMRVDMSMSGAWQTFSPYQNDGSITDENAISLTLASESVCAIRWLKSEEHGMPVGTAGGEWVIKPSNLNEALTPTNITAKRITSYGTDTTKPVLAGRSTIYLQRTLRKVRELAYFYQIDGFRSEDLTLLAEHITSSGVTGQFAFTKEPQPIVWCVRNDGVLLGLTYERTLDALKAGWHRHVLGGFGDANGNPPVVESIATIPSQDGLRDDLWLIVKRYVNGATIRSIEFMYKMYETADGQENAYHLDCGITFDTPITVTGITNANPAVVTATAHGLSNGDQVRFKLIPGMSQVIGPTYTVAGVAANTFQLSGIDSTAYTAFTSGGTGQVRKVISALGGITWLKNETVSILADGAPQPNAVISNSGVVTLPYPACTVSLGYTFNSDVQLLRIDGGSADGTSIGKIRRINEVALMLLNTLGLSMGTSFTQLDPLVFRTADMHIGRAPTLFTGLIKNTIEANYDTENQICLRQSQPLPFTLLAVAPQMVTHDQG